MSAATVIEWAPLLPWSVIAAVAVAAVLVVGLAAWRRARGTLWRALAALALLAVLANPTLVREAREAEADIALIVVDESPSQDIAPRAEQTEAIVAGLEDRFANLRDTEVRIVRGGRPDDVPPSDGTKLFADVSRALAEVPRERLAGVLLVSDGQVHDVAESVAELGIDAPIHLLRTGGEEEGDRRLVIEDAPSYGIVGREQSMTVKVEDLPERNENAVAHIRLSRDGGEPLVRRIPVGEAREVTFTLDRRGPTVIEVEVEAGPRELTMQNNRAAVVVEGVRDRLRVLLVSGEPHAGERAWRHLLKSDPSVDLVHFTILRPPEKQDGTPISELSLIAFPTRELFEEKIEDFDLIIFDRYRQRGVLPQHYLDNISRYVERGGALLEAGGPSFASRLSLYNTPLRRVLPGSPTGTIFEEGFHPRVSELGQRHPVTAGLEGTANAAEPEWGRWFRQIGVDINGGEVLMTGVHDEPLMILDRVGEGRVAQLLSDHAWLWARGYDGGGPQAELMRRISHWLMKEPELEEEDLQADVSDGNLRIKRRSLSQEHPPVEVTAPDGSTQTLELEDGEAGAGVAEMPVGQLGIYEVSDGERTALAAAGELNPKEFQNVLSTDELLQPILEQSGGASVAYASDGVPNLRKVSPNRSAAGPGWIGLQDNQAYRVAGVSEMPLLPAVLALLLVLGALVTAWFREGR